MFSNGFSNGKIRVNGEVVRGTAEFRVAIVGGGPGGLFSAWCLAEKAGTACDIKIFEASDRVGGKIVTKKFSGVGPYEAGVAEIYDYSALGPDPLRDLIQKDLRLEITPISGGGCILDGRIVPDTQALAEHFGLETYQAAVQFRDKCAGLLTPKEFYKSVRDADNTHPWANLSADDILATEIEDDTARRYIRVMCHSDVAAPPHLTTGLTLLKNVLMDVDGYLDIYSVNGGNEQIVQRLSDQLDADIQLCAPVRTVQPLEDGKARLTYGAGGANESYDADFVIFALPITALSIIDWRHPALHKAMFDHVRHFDRPGHYLRATMLFESPFWRSQLDGAWWMCDAFDGCCVYDEGARQDLGNHGMLGFLIAGNAALGMANFSDERIEEMCLDALPPQFAGARKLLLDTRVHRWMASVNAVPGGLRVRDRWANHRPIEKFPQILVCGDYLFDSTLNGVLDSAESSTDLILADIMRRRRSDQRGAHKSFSPGIGENVRDQFFSSAFLADMLNSAWDLQPGAKVLNLGSSSGATVRALRDAGYDAYGIESSHLVHARTLDACRDFNLHGEPTRLPFPDGFFDVVIETGLCNVPQSKIKDAITELRRVTRRGVMLGSIVTDLTIEMIDRHDLQVGIETLWARWNWAEEFYANGFDHTLSDPDRLARVWKCAQRYGAGPGHWYEEPEAILYGFFDVDSPAVVARPEISKTKIEPLEIAQFRLGRVSAGQLFEQMRHE